MKIQMKGKFNQEIYPSKVRERSLFSFSLVHRLESCPLFVFFSVGAKQGALKILHAGLELLTELWTGFQNTDIQ